MDACFSDIIHLNVGGRKFSTSRNTLLWSGNSFFSILLSGRLPSFKDEQGSFFIDRDPDLFGVILNYLRTGELSISGTDPVVLKNEALFYGLNSLVEKLSLCEENFYGRCGDLLFHAYMPPPIFVQRGESSDELIVSPFGTEQKTKPTNLNNPVSLCNTQTGASVTSLSSQTSAVPKVLLRRAKGDNVELLASPANSQEVVPPMTQAADIEHGSVVPLFRANPVTLIVCHQNVMAAVYKDHVGIFSLKDSTGWHLVWLSPFLSAPIDRIALSSKVTTTLPVVNAVNPTNSAASGATYPGAQNGLYQQQQPAFVQNQSPSPTSLLPASALQSSAISLSSHSGSPSSIAPGAMSLVSTSTLMLAASVGSAIFVWCLYPPASSNPSAIATCGGAFGVFTSSATYDLSPLTSFSPSTAMSIPGHHSFLPRAKDPWASELVGRYDLNRRAVDYIMFIDSHLVALSRHGLVGVRHMMTNAWQVWSTVPILSYGVAASELLLLGCANGRICSINIQKFPLRIVDNDLLVTEMYRDPLQDPITALSVHLTKTAQSSRSCMEIAYGTLSGRVCLIVQYPENVGFSPQPLQMFTVHRAMVTRVVLSEKHLISVCNEFNHVRTWLVNRFRGIISTQPGSAPIASFHVTSLDTSGGQRLVQSVLNSVRRCASRSINQSTIRNTTMPTRCRAVQAPTTHVDRSQLQQRQHRQLQSFLFPQWRRYGSRSHSPGTTLDQQNAIRLEISQSEAESTSLTTSNNTGSRYPENSYHDCLSELPGTARLLAPVNQPDAVVLPRTSWLHEDPGNLSARASLMTINQQDATANELLHSSASPFSLCSGSTVARCQTFHETSSPIANTDSPDPSSMDYRNTSNRSATAPSIPLHQFANDPGPYGEREDVLVFVQKLTPDAHQLFVRFAATGKRVCVIRSVDATPITSFCVHEHDGSNRVGAHPRRYLFTGHIDGSIQAWDLSTALNFFKHSNLLGPMQSITSDCSNQSVIFSGMVNNLSAASTAVPHMIALGCGSQDFAPVSFPPSFSSWPSGPTSRELIRILETCQLSSSSTLSSGPVDPSPFVTPANSIHSICQSTLSGPTG